MKTKKVILSLGIVLLSVTFSFAQWSLTGNSITNNTNFLGLLATSTQTFTIKNAATTPINFLTGSSTTPKLTILTGGNVGIGTPAPNEKLDVQSALTNDVIAGFGSVGSPNYLYISNLNTLNGGYNVNGNSQVYINNAGYLNGSTQFRDLYVNNGKGSTIALFQGSSGNVGIGTTSLGNYRLSIVQPQTALSQYGLYVAAGYTATDPVVYFTGNTAYPSQTMVMQQNGWVGIGTTTPGNKLDVSGTANQLRLAAATAGQEASMVFSPGGALNSWQTGVSNAVTSNGWWLYETTGGYRMVVQQGGNVGIGTTNPQGQLHLASNNNHEFRISRANNTFGFRIFRDATSGIIKFDIGTTSSTWETKIQIGEGEGTNTKLLLNPNGGNVLIGKTSQVNSIYKLDVNGSMRANEVVVNTTGADFVFDENYKLRKLEEVEKFIKENKHLPEIQSASEMQDCGLEVGKLNTTLLQKVEEITLYMIQMNNHVAELNKKVEQLESENVQLKTIIKK